MEFAEESRSPWRSRSSAEKAVVAERRLDRVLAVVEVAPNAEHPDVRSLLRDHLLALQIAHAVCRVEDDDAGVGPVGEAVERRLAGVARGCYEDEEVLGERAGGLLGGDRFGEEERHALQRHVLERARRAVPELEHVRTCDDLGHRCDARVGPLVAVRGLHELRHALRCHVHAEAHEEVRRPLPVGERGVGEDLLERQ
jgi:hypothetical protein